MTDRTQPLGPSASSADPTPAAGDKHLALVIELPCMFTNDLDDLREFAGPDESESDFILNCIGEPGIVRLRMEISGEKDSSIVEVWGHVREALLVKPDRGYGNGPKLTDEQLAHGGWKLLRDDGCEWCHMPEEEATDADTR